MGDKSKTLKCIVTGAAGFAGCNLVEALLSKGFFVYAIVRPESPHNRRLIDRTNLQLIELDMCALHSLHQYIHERVDYFFHFAWNDSARNDSAGQYVNVLQAVDAVEVAGKIGCGRFIGVGSQAEYGIVKDVIKEDRLPLPNTSYGAAKVAALYLTKRRAEQLGIEWMWGRIFSLYGKYEPEGRLFPYLCRAFLRNEIPHLSSAAQNWDYLYAADAAEAFIAMAERGRPGEIYNVANGAYRPLRGFVEEMRCLMAPNTFVEYGKPSRDSFWLQPSVDKLQQDTGWLPRTSFAEGVKAVCDLWERGQNKP